MTNGIVNALRAAMESESLFCRVRMDAAMALAASAGTDYNGAHPALLFREEYPWPQLQSGLGAHLPQVYKLWT